MSVASWTAIIAGTLTVVGLLLLYLGPARGWSNHLFIPRRGHLIALALALTAPSCAAMLVSLAGRVKLDGEIRERIREGEDALEREALTRAQVADIARRQSKPTAREFASLLDEFNRTCQPDPRCQALYARSVNRVLRVNTTTGAVVPRVRTPRRPDRSQPQPRPPQIPPPPLAPPGRERPTRPDQRVSQLEEDVRNLRQLVDELRARPNVDSALVDGLDQRLRDVERLAEGLRQAVCSPLLARLLVALNVCR